MFGFVPTFQVGLKKQNNYQMKRAEPIEERDVLTACKKAVIRCRNRLNSSRLQQTKILSQLAQQLYCEICLSFICRKFILKRI